MRGLVENDIYQFWNIVCWNHDVLFENELLRPESQIKRSFVNMLDNIVKTNEKRMNALKKIAELQDSMVTQHGSEFMEEPFDSDESTEGDSAIVALLDVMQNSTFRKMHNSIESKRFARNIFYLPISNSIRNHENSEQDNDFLVSEHGKKNEDELNIKVIADEENKGCKVKSKLLDTLSKDFRRRGYKYTCSREGEKACRAACNDARRSFCRIYSCSSRAKKTFKTECKYSCRSKFKSNVYSDVE